jgi:branched-chain amino acid transport system ATP-binding protein
VSQEVLQTLSISDEAYLLEHGKIVMRGNAQDMLADPKVKESYLGI